MARRDVRRASTPSEDPQPRPKRRWFRRLFIWGTVIALLAIAALGIAVAMAARSIPGFDELKETAAGQTIVVRARDGSELLTMGPSPGNWLRSDEIPQVMKDAMISVEDRRFRSHFGVDPIGLARAVWVATTGDRRIAATSTISQQLARNVFLNNSRTFGRKAREAILAMALEAKFSKEQILELYLNKVYFGGGAYGVDAASRKFFSHSARDLNVGEAAIIAGLVKAPSRYSPTADVQAAVKRANIVLQLMKQEGAIGAAEADAIDVSTVKLKPEAGQNSARYFTDWVLEYLDLVLPDTQEPLEVWTTLDAGMQRAATSAIQANAPKGAQGALVSLDRDGAVLAMVGGTDYVSSNYNRAIQAVRQPGSAWKLFVYMAALEAGYLPDDRVVDEPVTINGWSPRNSGGTYAGPIDVRTAFAYSKNTVAAQLGNEVGFGSVASMARRFGITTPIATNPSMVLGTSEVRLIDMTRAFAAVSARGMSVEPYGVMKVTTANGRVLYQHEAAKGQQLVPDYVAAGITDLLQTAVNVGTGKAAQIGRPVAGKTGTTSSNKDGWFLGFSSGITTGVWMGRDDARAVPGLQGGTAPARAFATYMRQAVAKRPVEQFATDLKLPEWKLEPDEEYLYGDPSEYYYVDEDGNLVDQNRRTDWRDDPYPPPEQQPGTPPPAANQDFLDQATGGAANARPESRGNVNVGRGSRPPAPPGPPEAPAPAPSP
ncbi:putative penicillin-binding protein [Caenibius tardaugens NBRC 16725]|uniref:Putative penicillin-binding protein n=1 Tax=Caenibius tardaugens NBRC 16725 TaxID=1219035 RepID=U2YQ99_9SPHN|nr:PBP1A family penicillin-binding protein [Caenibius tardaugens]AZI36381.1 PBP1A family penicillin-binding protein [Caenibius tardaugens NBRC 16725]GAD50812.1 putative penicillin-binding protein [Caenibius tardaugens NBRC 16725]